MQTSDDVRLLRISIASLAAILLWDLSGLDLFVARAMASDGAFPLRSHFLLTAVMHSGGKYLALAIELALCIAIVRPYWLFRKLTLTRRVQLAVSVLVTSGVVVLLKSWSMTSCPWDLREFGGAARYVSHWSSWFVSDGGNGRCFPAGHASSGFAFLGGYFVFRPESPQIARRWFFGALGAGLVLGAGQQLRGAHFLSHTLWTGWICWMGAFAIDAALSVRNGHLSGHLAQSVAAPDSR